MNITTDKADKIIIPVKRNSIRGDIYRLSREASDCLSQIYTTSNTALTPGKIASQIIVQAYKKGLIEFEEEEIAE